MVLEEKLRLKKIKLQKLDDDLRVMKDKFAKGMNEHKSEILTNEGISTNATLTVTLLEAKELKPMDYNGTSDPYVILELEGKKYTSSYKPATLEPVWNEDFTFQIVNKNGILKVDVYDKDTVGTDDFEGGLQIPIKSFQDQQRHDDWYDLVLQGNSRGNGSIRLRIQFIWSRYKYFSDNFNKTEMQIMRLQEDINELNRYFEIFKKPFGIVIYGEIDTIFEKRILERSEDIAQYIATSRKTVFASPRFSVAKSGIAFRVENAIKTTFSNFIFNIF